VTTPELWVHDEVMDQLLAVPVRAWEVGGWLLGYWTEDSIVVTHATPPNSRGTPFGVTISGRGHRRDFDRAWGRTGGRVTFLGDWHTHPGVPAEPSTKDDRAAAQLASDPDFQTPRPLLGIVATARWPWQQRPAKATFWLRERDGELVELEPTTFSALPPATVF
jgi:integrative and conjugative element protein (TIGR02256 family)